MSNFELTYIRQIATSSAVTGPHLLVLSEHANGDITVATERGALLFIKAEMLRFYRISSRRGTAEEFTKGFQD